MPAHLRDLSEPCEWPECKALAVKGLFNTHNERIGGFCRVHADIALRQYRERYEAQS